MQGLSLVVASGGHSSSRCTGLSLSRPFLLRSTGSRRAGSAVVAHGPSCSAACGILPDQGSNPCPLYWQADSQPLRHQGSPVWLFKKHSASFKFSSQVIKDFKWFITLIDQPWISNPAFSFLVVYYWSRYDRSVRVRATLYTMGVRNKRGSSQVVPAKCLQASPVPTSTCKSQEHWNATLHS